jgi:two-component sensor histidine kinase
VLSRWLQGHAPSGVIDDAQLVVTELITNSLEHAGVSPDDELGLSIELGYGWVRIEVQDPGDGGLIAPRGPDLLNGGGFGLNIVAALAAQWGAVREGSTCVWAELTWPTDAILDAA